jgi:hypothetical protein
MTYLTLFNGGMSRFAEVVSVHPGWPRLRVLKCEKLKGIFLSIYVYPRVSNTA